MSLKVAKNLNVLNKIKSEFKLGERRRLTEVNTSHILFIFRMEAWAIHIVLNFKLFL